MSTFVNGKFEWDPLKEVENIRKHGIDFQTALEAFLDPARLIAVDEHHSAIEERLYCIGNTKSGILTVRFTVRSRIRIIGAGSWRKGKKLYEKKITKRYQ